MSQSYGYTGEWYGGYIGLLHLRARWYAPGTGTLLSRDPVESEPPYLYVRGNPVNRIDPSGYNPCPSGLPCGPDVTEWFMQEIGLHLEYGKKVKADFDDIWSQMFIGTATNSFDLQRPPKLGELNLKGPFKEIVKLGDWGNLHGLASMELLRYAEFGMYGLAINYSDIEYYQLPRIGSTCGDQFCDNLGRGDVNHHKSVTLCGQCIDSSTLGRK